MHHVSAGGGGDRDGGGTDKLSAKRHLFFRHIRHRARHDMSPLLLLSHAWACHIVGMCNRGTFKWDTLPGGLGGRPQVNGGPGVLPRGFVIELEVTG